MRTHTMWARTERLAFVVWLTASVGACTGWQTVEVTPQQLIDERHPSTIRVTRQDGSRVELAHPYTVGDTLLGSVEPVSATTQTPSGHWNFSTTTTPRTAPADTAVRVAIPVADAVRIQQRHVSSSKTAELVFGLLVVGALVAAGIAFATWDSPL